MTKMHMVVTPAANGFTIASLLTRTFIEAAMEYITGCDHFR